MATKAADNRYRRVKYNQTKYGASSSLERLVWDFSFDWDGDGNFDNNEASRVLALSVDRGRTNFIKPRGEGYEPVKTGQCKITLSNHDGRYDGWNSSSPLYPNVTYGKDVRVRVRDMETGTVHPVFYGVISNIEPTGYGTNREVVITLEDGWRFLREYNARVALQENITLDDAIGLVLDYVGWPARWGRALDISSDIIPHWWASGDKKAGSELEDMVNSFLGYFFIAADGSATYRKRQSVGGSVVDLYQSQLLKDISNPVPWQFHRNVTRFRVHPRLVASTGTIWQFEGDNPSVPVGGSTTLWANYSYLNSPCPAKNVVTPVASTDWTANTSSDGSGTDKTADVSFSFTDFGDTAKLTFTNNSGVVVYIISPKIRGDAVYAPYTTDVTYPADPASVSQPRELFVDLPWQQDINVAINFAEVIGPFMDGLHPFPAVQLEGRPSLQFPPDLFDIITLTSDTLGIGGTSFRVSGIRHESLSSMQAFRTIFTLEPYLSTEGFWTWDTASVFDSSTVFGW